MIEFYEDEAGDQPVKRWMREGLSATKRRALGKAMQHVLQAYGTAVCKTRYGRQLGAGLFEFRLDENLREIVHKYGGKLSEAGDEGDPVLLRVFCHAHGNKIILLLGGYDKGSSPGKRAQSQQIELARKRLRDWKSREQ
ncbi:MAG: hypothetical protein IT381_22160 [Deltaproteobacteria bacterium]|nr:hypothetical protein [Deltaproteobacteria bacterium]